MTTTDQAIITPPHGTPIAVKNLNPDVYDTMMRDFPECYKITQPNPDSGVDYYTVEQNQYDTLRSYLLDEHGRVVADTGSTQNWPAFYKNGWDKTELHRGARTHWDCLTERETDLQILKNRLTPEQAEYLQPDSWVECATDSELDYAMPVFQAAWTRLPHDNPVFLETAAALQDPSLLVGLPDVEAATRNLENTPA